MLAGAPPCPESSVWIILTFYDRHFQASLKLLDACFGSAIDQGCPFLLRDPTSPAIYEDVYGRPTQYCFACNGSDKASLLCCFYFLTHLR